MVDAHLHGGVGDAVGVVGLLRDFEAGGETVGLGDADPQADVVSVRTGEQEGGAVVAQFGGGLLFVEFGQRAAREVAPGAQIGQQAQQPDVVGVALGDVFHQTGFVLPIGHGACSLSELGRERLSPFHESM